VSSTALPAICDYESRCRATPSEISSEAYLLI
jgi:hypothetical protein